MRKIFISVLLALLLVGGASPAYAVPALPHAFYGSVSVNGGMAADGTQVSATVDDGTVLPTQNPVPTAGGSYGVDSPKLLVQGEISPGATITFHVTNTDGTAVGGTYVFEAGGGPTLFDLSVEITEPEPEPKPSPPGGGGPLDVETNYCGVSGSFYIDSNGRVIQTVEAGCKDGALTVTIEKGTIALNEKGRRLKTLEIAEDPDPPELPEGNFIGVPYSLGPSGASFDPPLILTWAFDPKDLPEGVAPKDLKIAYWDGDEWLSLTGVVDTVKNIVTAEVDHFTTFALVSPAAEVVVAPPPPPEPTPQPTPPEPAKPTPEPVKPPVEPTPPPVEPTPEAPFNWLYAIGFPVAAILIIALAILYMHWRRRAR